MKNDKKIEDEILDAIKENYDVENEKEEKSLSFQYFIRTFAIVLCFLMSLLLIYQIYDYYHMPSFKTGIVEETVKVTAPNELPDEATDDMQVVQNPRLSKNVVASLTVDGGDITDDPILQHKTDKDYYLRRNEFDSYSIWGCYYVLPEAKLASIDDLDKVTVIFGHSNGNSTSQKFSALKKLKDVNYAQEHQYIYLKIGDKTATFKIFAAADYPVKNNYLIRNPDDKYFLQEIAQMKELSYNQYSTDVLADDKIVILSTCTRNNSKDLRYIVCAKLENIE